MTLDNAIKIAVAFSASRRHLAACKEEEEIHAVKKEDEQTYMRNCKFCARKHKWGREFCPAYGKVCEGCGEKNHFVAKCPAPKGTTKKKTKGRRRQVNAIADESVSEDSGEEFVMAVGRKTILAEMHVIKSDKYIKFQIDTGASVNVILQSLVCDEELQPASCTLKVWNEQEVQPLGKCRTTLRNMKNRKKYNVEFVVVKEELTPILSKRACEQMGLITINYENIKAVKVNAPDALLEEYSEVFGDGLGVLPGEVQLTINKEVPPVAIASCRVPVSLKKKVKSKLRDMEVQGVIEKVEQPTEWVSRMVTSVKSNGDIRICIDPQALNKALQREMHPLLTIEEVLPELAKARVFSKFDLRSGYWHCILDKKSSDLTTFQTPYGRFKWKRLPFGLKVSSEIFQKRLQQILEDIPNCICVADDILIYGTGSDDGEAQVNHDKALKMLLQRCKETGVKLNKQKTVLRESEVLFLGHRIGCDGVGADPSKVEAIKKMKRPNNPREVLQVAGMVNYLAKFLPRLADVMRPLRKLTCKDAEWDWGEEQEVAFKQIQDLVTQAPVLSFYDENLPLEIQCDASQSGIGAVLLQNGKPLSYASRAMTPTETRYAQIEKEMLSIIFAVKRFHQYTYGRKVTVQTDHKPLETIVKKALCLAPKRLQGMMLKLQEYDTDIKYTPGKEMHIADLLSRSYLPTTKGAEEFEMVNHVAYLPIRQDRLERIQGASESDPVLRKVRIVISEGWPDNVSEVPVEVRPYFHHKDELITQDGLIFKGAQVVIPELMRGEIREALHVSHMGVESTLRRARQCVFWPSMNNELKQFIGKCEVCAKYNKRQQKETLMSHEPAVRPWEKVGIDLFEFDSKDYLIVVDYFTNWWEFDRLHKTTSRAVIDKLKCHFTRFGIPSILVSDNGPQFISDEFNNFVNTWDIEHRTSSPGHQQANGLAEASVKSAKRLMKKTRDSGKDLMLALLEYRNVPSQDVGTSPTQRMFGRMTRTLLPVRLEKLTNAESETVKANRRLRDMRKEWYYDKNAKELEPLVEGQIVRMRPMTTNNEHWRKAVVKRRYDERSYEIESDGMTYRRNRVDLRATLENGDKEPSTSQSCNMENQNVTSQKNLSEPTKDSDEGTGNEQSENERHKEQPRTEIQENMWPGEQGASERDSRRSRRQKKTPEYLKDYVT